MILEVSKELVGFEIWLGVFFFIYLIFIVVCYVIYIRDIDGKKEFK